MKSTQFQVHTTLPDSSLGHVIPNGKGDQATVMEAIRDFRAKGGNTNLVVRNSKGDVVAHAER